MKRNEICILICTERGFLEAESILLCRSLREFGGAFSRVPILSFAPRKGMAPSSKTRKVLDGLEVDHKNLILNKKFSDYPYANKVMVADYAQKYLPYEKFVFLDSDMINLGEPTLLSLREGHGAAVGPVHNTISASTGSRGVNEKFWREMYRRFDIEDEHFLKSVLERKRIRAYWNAGVIVVRKNTEVFSLWRETMEKMFEFDMWPSTGKHFCDEIAMTLALLKQVPYGEIRQLPISYNYPMYAYKRMSAQKRWLNPESAVFYHYMNLFEIFPFGRLDFLNKSKSKKTRWIRENLGLLGLDIK